MSLNITQGTVYQIRNRIACGFGKRFGRDSNYSLLDIGDLVRTHDGRIIPITRVSKFNWKLLP